MMSFFTTFAATKKSNRFHICLKVISFIIVLPIFISGCNKQTRHDLEAFLIEEKKTVSKTTLFSHTPYADGQCDQCHQASGFSLPQGKPTGRFGKGGGMPGKLIMPVEELCIHCHEYRNFAKVTGDGLWLHTPAAEGECMECHDPHQSQNPNVLLETPERICNQCHDEDCDTNIPDHRETAECLKCHTPHLGRNSVMLKRDYTEVKNLSGL
jgi:predicted CXXCH cytochrome family protein